MSSLESQLHGLVWVQKTFGLEPRWSFEPDIEAIRQTIQRFRLSSTVEVNFLVQGAFNKLYDLKLDDEMLIMRISLPVDPRYKTTSEVATVDWVHRTTNIPVPSIVSYQSSRNNLIGFEWILMTKMPGKPLAETWRSLSFAAKSRLVMEFAAYSSCLFRNQLRGIGNVYERSSLVEDSVSTEEGPPTREQVQVPLFTSPDTDCSARAVPEVSRIVSIQFFWGSHIYQDIYRGPFPSSKDWISARLTLSEYDCHSILAKYLSVDDLDSDDGDEVEDATRTLRIIEKLRSLLSLVFPTNDQNPEQSIIFHDDLSRHNILIGKGGELAGVLDWECVSALPLWKACYYPSFLEGPPRRLEPNIGRYHRETNGEPSDLYWDHLWEYEATILRDVFIDEMKQLEPGWVDVFNTSQVQRDFDIAVQNCDNELVARHINEWIEDITTGKGNLWSLRDRIAEA
ncbi:hypothetical protein V1517DRAFT_195653 [Lipomyces orientalis]|uniref:Uncharacterized protein n=1 Tax=Lipomyces orientalis TaxID=1233043 RepID=A0ACC3TI13_9ASCO